MTYPRRLLSPGEDVVIDLRPHWAFLGWPLVLTTGAVVLTAGVALGYPGLPTPALDGLLALVALCALWLVGRALRWVTTSLVLTTTRIVERSGVLGRRAVEIRLERINELSYHQSLGARLARTGEVMVEIGGETGVVTFEHVPRPAAFQSLITGQITARHDGWVRTGQIGGFVSADRRPPARYGPAAGHAPAGADTPPAGGPAVAGPSRTEPPPAEAGPTVADRLIQLGELRRRGIVSAEEFEAKKAELLREL